MNTWYNGIRHNDTRYNYTGHCDQQFIHQLVLFILSQTNVCRLNVFLPKDMDPDSKP
jgi:hypothetical protein